MASKHRRGSREAKRIAAAGLATATIAALTVGAAPVPLANAASTAGALGQPPMQLAPGAPDPSSIPDLTFGLGPRGYDEFQTLGAAVDTALVNNVDLSKLLGYDPATINTALGAAITQALGGIPVDLNGVPVLGPILTGAGITNAGALLKLLGFGLPGGATPGGTGIITAGPPFTLLKLLGVDIGYTPAFPNSIADQINGTDYLDVGAVTTLQTLLAAYPVPPLKNTIQNAAIQTAIATVDLAGGDKLAADVRVPVVVGFGLGAFAAGMAYPQVVADLENQPGGAANDDGPLGGSFTILPMILLRNPGRANGGLFARFYPEAALLGIDTVTPDTEVTSSGPGTPVDNTGIKLGAANLIPIKVDGTVEYDPLSDFPAWPNPVALANSGAALLFPTYILRGVTAASATEVVDGQLKPQLQDALGNTSGPLALNLYLTVPVNDALPLLEPVKLPVDVINLLTGANLNNPVATALEPALTSLVNLGYTDVVRKTGTDGVPEYDRTLDQAGVITPFGTLPSGIDWAKVPGDLAAQLLAGTQKSIGQGLISDTPVANPLAVLANVVGLSGLPGAAAAPSPLVGGTDLTGLAGDAMDSAAGATVPATQAQGAVASAAKQPAPATKATPTKSVAPKVRPSLGSPLTLATTSPEAAAKRAQNRLDASFKKATDSLDKIAKDGQKQLQKVVKQAQDNVSKTVKAVAGDHDSAKKPSTDAKD